MPIISRAPMCANTQPYPGDSDPDPNEALRRVQDARDYAEAQARRRNQSNRDDADLRAPKAGAR